MIPTLFLILLIITSNTITCEEESIWKENKKPSSVRRRDQWFGASVLPNGYCGTSEADASSRCILCRDESECSDSEQCILIENCGANIIYGEYQIQEPEVQSGYCAPTWTDAAKCTHQDYICVSDDECFTGGHSCFFSIDWCVPGQTLQTFFCAKDLDDAQKCEESKQCYSEYDFCLGEGETCIETDTCSMVAFETSSPTDAVTEAVNTRLNVIIQSNSPSSSPTFTPTQNSNPKSTITTDPPKNTNPESGITTDSSASNSSIRNKAYLTLVSIFVTCSILVFFSF